MPVVIRMARAGTKKRPVYHIVAADSRAPRDGRFIERLGYFNPLLPKDKEERLKLDMDKVKAWMAKGAQPSDRVMRFLDAAGVAKREKRNNPEKAIPRKERKAASEEKPEGRGRRQGRSQDQGRRQGPGRRPPPQQPRRSRHVGRRDRPHLRCPDRRRARHSRRGEAAVVHRGPDGDHAPTVRWKARTARGASTIEALRPAKDHFVARLAGVADRDAAEKLTNIKLYVSRDRLPPIEDDETFYHADLVGLAAVTPDGAPLGTVTAIHQFRRRRPRRDQAAGRRRAADGAVHRRRGAGDRHRRRAAWSSCRSTHDRVTAMWRATVLTLFPEMFPGPLGAEPRRQGAGGGRLVARRA